MCTRDEVDKKNMERINNMLDDMPGLVRNYLDSITEKTSYTKKAYIYYIKLFIDYMKNELKLNVDDMNSFGKILPMHIDSYMKIISVGKDGKQNSATYKTANIAAISGFFGFLKRNKIITDNPCDDIQKPKDKSIHQITFIDHDDYEIMINNILKGTGSKKARSTQIKWQNRDIAILTLGITTGIRVSAIVGLNIDDINFNEKYIRVTEKGARERQIYIGEKTINIMKKWMTDREHMDIIDKEAIFIAQGGHRIAVRTVQELIKRLAQGTGKHITPHKMRATCATNLYEKTGDIYRVQQQLGHKNIRNTERYAKYSEARQRESADILDNII